MTVLSFDTSGDTLSLGVYEKGRVLYEEEASLLARHSAALVPSIYKALKSARKTLEKIDAIAVGTGPGSFTGLRVGLVTAKVLAHVLSKKLYGISSLDAAARSLEFFTGDVAFCLNARKSNAYVAVYRKTVKGLTVLLKPALMPAKNFLSGIREPVFLVSDLVTDAAAQKFMINSSLLLAVASPSIVRPRARWIADAVIKGQARQASPNALEPLYLYARDCNVTPRRTK